MSEEFYRRYSRVPSQVKRVTDPIVKSGIKVSPIIDKLKTKGDVWLAKKKRSIGR